MPKPSLLDDDARGPRLLTIALWSGLAVVTVGFLVGREAWRARQVERRLEERIEDVGIDLARLRAADPEAVARTRDELRAAAEGLQPAIPCASDLQSLLASLRAAVEPLGFAVRDDLGGDRRKDFYREVLVPLQASRPAAVDDVRTALAGSSRLLWIVPGPAPTVHVTTFYWGDDGPGCGMPSIGGLGDGDVPGRADLRWPFDRRVAELEAELARLRSERAGHAPLLLLQAEIEDLRRRIEIHRELIRRRP